MTTFDYGPIDVFAIGFAGDRPGPEIMDAIDALVQAGTVNLLDLVFAARSIDGELRIVEVADTTDDGAPALDLLGLAAEEDVQALAADVPPGSSVAILVVELLWAKRFASALYEAGGVMLARHGIPAPVVNAILSEHATEASAS